MKYLVPVFLVVFLLGASLDDARKANKAYKQGNYEQAISLYKKAIKQDDKNAKLYYNLANALAKDGKSEDAVRYYEQYKQMTKSSVDKAKADYNIGNIYSKSKQWDKAIEYYKKAMRSKADDFDAKHNYELAKRQKQKKQKNKNNNKNKNKKDKKNKKKDNKQQKDKKNQQNKNQQNKQNQKDNKQQKNQKSQKNDGKKSNQKKQPRPNKMSKAEAKNILKALENQEKDLLKQFKKQKTKSSNTTHEKDW